MNEDDLKKRTKQFALRVIKMSEALPNTVTGRVIQRQIVRCGTAVGANYRAACRGRSKAEFASKLAYVEEEADETAYWMELIMEAKLLEEELIADLLNEANELTAIMVASRITAKRKAVPETAIKDLKSTTENRKSKI
ncbi:MAG: four helix bundle protein [Kiritimatiellia bacterium]